MSSEVIYSQNKHLAYFHLLPSVDQSTDPLLRISTYTTFIYHYHYPVIYYEELLQHFQHCLPPNTVPGNMRILYKNKQLPHQLPIGVFLDRQNTPKQFFVSVDLTIKVADAFRVIKNSWKKTFEVINYNRRCDYVKARLSEDDVKKKFKDYCNGKTHNFHNEGLYEGTHAIVRGIVKENVIERKFAIDQYQTVESIAREMFSVKELWQGQKQPAIYSHNELLPLSMPSKFFLDEWNYNDGYCYLLLDA